MNVSLRLNRLRAIQGNFSAFFAFLAKLAARLKLTRLTRPRDDPAALRYMLDKYNGEID